MKSKKPKSGKGERRRAIKPVDGWAVFGAREDDRKIWTHTIRRKRTAAIDNVVGGKPAFDRLLGAGLVRLIRVRIVPLNPKRKAK